MRRERLTSIVIDSKEMPASCHFNSSLTGETQRFSNTLQCVKMIPVHSPQHPPTPSSPLSHVLLFTVARTCHPWANHLFSTCSSHTCYI